MRRLICSFFVDEKVIKKTYNNRSNTIQIFLFHTFRWFPIFFIATQLFLCRYFVIIFTFNIFFVFALKSKFNHFFRRFVFVEKIFNEFLFASFFFKCWSGISLFRDSFRYVVVLNFTKLNYHFSVVITIDDLT